MKTAFALVFVWLVQLLAAIREENARSNYFNMMLHHRLVGHLLTTTTADTELTCAHKCLANEKCKSCNFKTFPEQEGVFPSVCELNTQNPVSGTNDTALISDRNFVFISLEDILEQITIGKSDDFIEPDIYSPWGKWGTAQFCPRGSFAYAFRLKVESPLGNSRDDTALNAIKLYCRKPDGGGVEGVEPTSSVGPWGSWDSSATSCCCNLTLEGFRLLVESDQGPTGDNTAANNIRMSCGRPGVANYNLLQGRGTSWGDWSSHVECKKGYAICGLQTSVEEQQGSGDDTALNSVRFYCCDKS